MDTGVRELLQKALAHLLQSQQLDLLGPHDVHDLRGADAPVQGVERHEAQHPVVRVRSSPRRGAGGAPRGIAQRVTGDKVADVPHDESHQTEGREHGEDTPVPECREQHHDERGQHGKGHKGDELGNDPTSRMAGRYHARRHEHEYDQNTQPHKQADETMARASSPPAAESVAANC